MALRFTVSAPGKVILTGEHSVVYGKAAVAGTIDLRNQLQLEASCKTHIRFEFDLFAAGQCSVPLEAFNELLARLVALCAGRSLPDAIPHGHVVRLTDELAQSHCQGIADDPPLMDEFRRSCSAAFYLLGGNLCAGGGAPLQHGFTVRFKSGLTKGAGLGSSASFGVCLAMAFHFYATYRQRPQCIRSFNATAIDSDERQSVLREISSWAFCSERIMHGNPSGLDNTVCTFGGLVKFYKQQGPIGVPLSIPLDILLIDSAVSRSTRDQVAKVARLTDDHPAVLDAVMLSFDRVVDAILGLLADDQRDYAKLGRLLTLNNDLLRTIGVSHATLEKIVELCNEHGLAAKLTGAGGGGFAFALLAPDSHAGDLCARLTAAGFEWKRTTLGGTGVQIEDQTE